MKWQEARKHYPDEWLLIEAIHAHSVNDKRILDDLAVLNAYDNSVAAMKEYGKFHRESPQRELYVCHTVNETLDITERHWFGIRSAS